MFVRSSMSVQILAVVLLAGCGGGIDPTSSQEALAISQVPRISASIER